MAPEDCKSICPEYKDFASFLPVEVMDNVTWRKMFQCSDHFSVLTGFIF